MTCHTTLAASAARITASVVPQPSPLVALAGNPNVGKSTLFNALTGSSQHTGNWPGKTVERTRGRLTLDDHTVTVVDLPGIYSLAPLSAEESIARDFLRAARPTCLVAVVDASNLERNLALVLQLLELGLPLVVALTMTDTAAARGVHINPAALSSALGVPVFNASRGHSLDPLRRALLEPPPPPPLLRYHPVIEQELHCLLRSQAAAASQVERTTQYAMQPPSSRSDAIAALERDPAACARIRAALGDDPDILIADARFTRVAEIAAACTTHTPQPRRLTSDDADRILTHRWLGIPIFLALMALVFVGTARLSAPFVDLLDAFFSGPLTAATLALLDALGLGDTFLPALLTDGLIAGVGGVLSFVPVLALLYLAIAILEDSGYMARAAFVMDRAMRLLGLHGKSFLPLLLGFGCTVPAVYATRTLESARDRRLTAFLATFMSCGARLPVYLVFATAFFGARAGFVLFGLYLTGILVALGTGLVARLTIHRRAEAQPFVLELPPYHLPHARTVARQVITRTGGFVRKAGTTILICALAVWFLLAIPRAPGLGSFARVPPEDSLFGSLSSAVAPILAPAGFGTWQAAGSLLTGLVAKEVLLSTLAQVYAVPDDAASENGERGTASSSQSTSQPASPPAQATLTAALRGHFTPAAALAFLLFVLLYSPCVSALASMRAEFGARFTLAQIAWTTGLAWLVAVLAYQIATRLGGLL